MERKVDVLVIGAGPAGIISAVTAWKYYPEKKIKVMKSIDKHPATLPGASKVKVKLIFSKYSGIILGGQVAGGISCGEIINFIGVVIQKRMSFTELETLQMATHPYLTSAPTVYPIVLAAQDASHKM